MTTQKMIMIAVGVAVMCIGAGFKVARYSAPPQRMNETFDQRLTRFLVDQGWQRRDEDPATKNNAVRIITFNKPNCSDPLRVSIVGTTSGLESYLRQTFGDDIAFVQHGAVLQHPDLLRHQVVRTWRGFTALLTGRSADRQPILAVIPAPTHNKEICAGPSRASWAQL